jgi:hypothetical protein
LVICRQPTLERFEFTEGAIAQTSFLRIERLAHLVAERSLERVALGEGLVTQSPLIGVVLAKCFARRFLLLSGFLPQGLLQLSQRRRAASALGSERALRLRELELLEIEGVLGATDALERIEFPAKCFSVPVALRNELIAQLSLAKVGVLRWPWPMRCVALVASSPRRLPLWRGPRARRGRMSCLMTDPSRAPKKWTSRPFAARCSSCSSPTIRSWSPVAHKEQYRATGRSPHRMPQ